MARSRERDSGDLDIMDFNRLDEWGWTEDYHGVRDRAIRANAYILSGKNGFGGINWPRKGPFAEAERASLACRAPRDDASADVLFLQA